MNKLILILILFAFAMQSCENAIDITPPTILFNHPNAAVYDSIALRVVQSGKVDSTEYKADYFYWYIENENGDTLKTSLPNSAKVVWVPDQKGYFLIKVRVGYNKNKSVTAIKEIRVGESVEHIKQLIIGGWVGIGHRGYQNDDWGITLHIDEKLHYKGAPNFYEFDSYCETGIWNTRALDYFTRIPNTYSAQFDSCGIPIELKGEKFVIDRIEDGLASGNVVTGYLSIYDLKDTIADYYSFNFVNMQIDSSSLYFESKYENGELWAWFRFEKIVF